MIRVLIVDDETHLVEVFKDQLTEEGMQVFTAFCGAEALSILKKETVDVVVLDIKLPDANGVNLLLKFKQREPTMEVIMLTGFASIDTAIKSMKLGAYDYLTKPCKLPKLSSVILKAYEKKTLKVKNIILEEHLHRIGAHDEFVGTSKEMGKVRNLVSIVALSNTPVLITGETGTGKELAARSIHDLSPRACNPFVAVNSAIFQETVLESELFGYKKGAFTGAVNDKLGLLEIANHGTFFIDEVGDMDLVIQAKVLRTLETGIFRRLGDTKEISVDIRFLFATNKELENEVKKGRFRKDLFFRINTFMIELPPLRRKRDDIPLLTSYFLDKFSRGGPKKRFALKAMELLTAYDWPGNVRELANVIERSILHSTNREEINVEDFPENIKTGLSHAATNNRSQGETMQGLDSLEKEHIKRVLKTVKGNKSKAARLLGITRTTLYSKLK
jgi:two-component system, NtrC family, response regulator AtoC